MTATPKDLPDWALVHAPQYSAQGLRTYLRRVERACFLDGKRVMMPSRGSGIVRLEHSMTQRSSLLKVAVEWTKDLKGQQRANKQFLARGLWSLRLVDDIDPIDPNVVWRFSGGWPSPSLIKPLAPHSAAVPSLRLVWPLDIYVGDIMHEWLDEKTYRSKWPPHVPRHHVEIFQSQVRHLRRMVYWDKESKGKAAQRGKDVVAFWSAWTELLTLELVKRGLQNKWAEKRLVDGELQEELTRHLIEAVTPKVPTGLHERLSLDRQLRHGNPRLRQLYLARWWWLYEPQSGMFNPQYSPDGLL